MTFGQCPIPLQWDLNTTLSDRFTPVESESFEFLGIMKVVSLDVLDQRIGFVAADGDTDFSTQRCPRKSNAEEL